MRKVFLIVVAFIAIYAFALASADAQYGQGLDAEELHSVALRAGDAMKEWHKEHGSFPNLDQEVDEALKFVFEKVTGAPVPPTTQVTYTGSTHSIENIRMSVDRSIRNASIEELQKHPPSTWTAPANSTVILTDGKDQFLIWTSVVSGTPMRDSNDKCKFVCGKLKPSQKEDDASDSADE